MKRKLTIGIVSAFLPPHLGGVEYYADNFSEELVNRGYKVILISTQYNTKLPTTQTDQLGRQIFRLPVWHLGSQRYPIVRQHFAKPTNELRKKIIDSGIDFYLCNTRFYVTTTFALKLAKKSNTPVLVLDHGSDFLTGNSWLSSKIIRTVEKIMTWRVKRYSPMFAGVSYASVNFLKRSFGIETDLVLYPGIKIPDNLVI